MTFARQYFIVPRVILPLILMLVAVLAAAAPAYGTDPLWMRYPHGLEIILLSRRLQWPLLTLSIILCITLIVLVISGKRRAWWLIGLAPVLALFLYKFSGGPMSQYAVAENPTMVSANQATFLADNDAVVGIEFGDNRYAYPFAALYADPVVIQSERDRRLVLFWSPFANRAQAFDVTREIKGRELEIVSMPADALLVYNSRHGQFINGVTGLTPGGERPIGLSAALPTLKTTWLEWRTKHPDTQVLPPPHANGIAGPIAPRYPLSHDVAAPANPKRITLVGTTQPAAVVDAALAADPANLTAGDVHLLLFRDGSGAVRVFDRRVHGDLFPSFHRKPDPKHLDAPLVDSDSLSRWTLDGAAIDGPLKGEKLKALPVDEDVYWEVMQAWYPKLQLLTPKPDAPEPEAQSPPTPGAATHPVRHRRRP